MADLEWRVADLEHLQDAHIVAATMLQPHMEEMEDRSRRNNLCLHGPPEATGAEELAATVADIFRKLLGEALPQRLEFYRIHRVLGPRSADPGRPRDVICRLHHYTHKESIIRRAWEAGTVDFDGAQVQDSARRLSGHFTEESYPSPHPGLSPTAISNIPVGIPSVSPL